MAEHTKTEQNKPQSQKQRKTDQKTSAQSAIRVGAGFQTDYPPEFQVVDPEYFLALSSASDESRGQTIRQIQQKLGNDFVQRLVSNIDDQKGGKPTGQPARPRLQRQDEDQPPVDLSGLELNQEMEGYGLQTVRGFIPSVMRQPAPVAGSGVQAVVTLTTNPPNIIRSPMTTISARHGRNNMAGWTTPRYSLSNPMVSGNTVSVNVILDFNIEEASEKAGTALDVINDHEQGHVHIGQEKAQTYLVDGFKSDLQAMATLSQSGYVSARDRAISQFTTQEGAASRAYDNFDYPRMALANTGTTTPLLTLANQLPSVAQMAAALRGYNLAMQTGRDPAFQVFTIDDASVVSAADTVVAARDALSDDQVSLLQYNSEFKSLVSSALAITDLYIQEKRRGSEVLNQLPSDENINPNTRSHLEVLKATLGGFTWIIPV